MVNTDGAEKRRIFSHAGLTEILTKNMESTRYARKMDSTGRILVPIRLREELNLATNIDYTFFTHYHNNKMYLCIECPDYDYTDKIEEAWRILENAGEIGSGK